MACERSGTSPTDATKTAAQAVANAWLLAAAEERAAGCPEWADLEFYVRGRTVRAAGEVLLGHVGRCSPCRTRMTSLRRMHRKQDDCDVWRLPDLRRAAGEGSGWAAAEALRAGDWLARLAAEAQPPAEGAGRTGFQVAAPLRIDGLGRLDVRIATWGDLRPGGRARVALHGAGGRLDLFDCVPARPAISAVVDLAACAVSSVEVPEWALVVDQPGPSAAVSAASGPDAARLALLLVAPEPTVIDRLVAALEAPGTAAAALDPASAEGATAALSDYIARWRLGNDGDVPAVASALIAGVLEAAAPQPGAVDTGSGTWDADAAHISARWTERAAARRAKVERELP